MKGADNIYDAVVVGGGPGGSVAALELARAGASVVLVDKAGFPRDKACGDVIGPRGVELLSSYGIRPEGLRVVADMNVVGPSGHRIRLTAQPGTAYPGLGWVVPRRSLDGVLRDAAIAAGAVPVTARAVGVDGAVPDRGSAGAPAEVRLDTGSVLRTWAVIGADGATSAVAHSAGMVRDGQVKWGFAIRVYLDVDVDMPAIVLFESGGKAFPGYGWLFPGPDGRSNAGVGVATGADRKSGAAATRELERFLGLLGRLELLDADGSSYVVSGTRLGGWVKMGMIGTVPAAGRVLLVGDAAGLVNPLQGEGISQAMGSGRAAARAVLAGRAPANAYRSWLQRHQAGFQGSSAVLQSALVTRPQVLSRFVRTLTSPSIGDRLAGVWSIYWSDLTSGAAATDRARGARLVGIGVRAATSAARGRRSLDADLRQVDGRSLSKPV